VEVAAVLAHLVSALAQVPRSRRARLAVVSPLEDSPLPLLLPPPPLHQQRPLLLHLLLHLPEALAPLQPTVVHHLITGQCLSNADCASGCCAGPSGICSGPGASFQNGKTGCGFSAATGLTASPAAAPAPPAAAAALAQASKGGPAFDPAGAKNVGNAKGGQFIGGQCLNSADCASGCCAGPSGICSGPGAQFQAGKTGCGFVSKKRFVSF
jgi:hypothetical protein